MKIQPIDNVSFNANVVVKTNDMKTFMRYLKENTDAPKGWYNSTQDLNLINKIFKAFEQHPSKEEITPDVYYINGALYNARGTLTSSKTKLTDTEPARSDSIAPILNIFRRILDPENKQSFNKLLGEEYSNIYDIWWSKNISPIWKDIQKNYRETTFFKGNYDKEFNSDFNNQTGNYWIKLWNKTV